MFFRKIIEFRLTITKFRDIMGQRRKTMEKKLYAAYETKSHSRLCLGVWKSIEDLARALRITPKSAWCNLYRTRKGRAFSISGIEVHRIDLCEEA